MHSDAAWARFSLSLWLISTGSVCLTRQERENLCPLVGEVGWGVSAGEITPLHCGRGWAGSESARGGVDSALSPNSFTAFFPFFSQASQWE